MMHEHFFKVNLNNMSQLIHLWWFRSSIEKIVCLLLFWMKYGECKLIQLRKFKVYFNPIVSFKF